MGYWEALLPSSLAHPTILLLLLLLPVLNSVVMATMSTTFQLPRDGLRRGGKRGARGRGGRERGLQVGRGTGGITPGSGLGVTLPRWFLPRWVPSGERGPMPARCVPRGQGWGSCPGEGAQSQPPSSERVGRHPQNSVPGCSHPAHTRARLVPRMSVATQLGGGANYSQTPPFFSLFSSRPLLRNLFIPGLSPVPSGFKGRFPCSYRGWGVKAGGCAGGGAKPAPASPGGGWAPGCPPGSCWGWGGRGGGRAGEP